MDALDIISLASAKNWLSVDEDDTATNDEITRLIKTAVAWVEKYTCYRLFERTETISAVNANTYIPYYPLTIVSVKDDQGNDAVYYSSTGALKLRVCTNKDNIITLTTGYVEVSAVPPPLVEACYKMITYLYENRDMYTAGLPTDVQILINQYRRALI